MYSLYLDCGAEQVEELSADLWEAGTVGVREVDLPGGRVKLIAGFESNEGRQSLLNSFIGFAPEWKAEADTDWAAYSRGSWPGRVAGDRFFIAAPWCDQPTPAGRMRLVQNPGLACGTGEHPCTRMAIAALEQMVTKKSSVADVGTGSGILTIAATLLGARFAFGIDLDESALQASRVNFAANGVAARVAAGSVECLPSACADVVVANISPSVVLSLADDLFRVVRPGGTLILTGFEQTEAKMMGDVFTPQAMLQEDGWACVISRAYW